MSEQSSNPEVAKGAKSSETGGNIAPAANEPPPSEPPPQVTGGGDETGKAKQKFDPVLVSAGIVFLFIYITLLVQLPKIAVAFLALAAATLGQLEKFIKKYAARHKHRVPHIWGFLLVTALLTFVGVSYSEWNDFKSKSDERGLAGNRYTNQLNRIETNLLFTQKSLDSIQHVITRFDSFSIDVVFNLPLTNAGLSAFTNDLLKLAVSLNQSQAEETNTILQFSQAKGEPLSSISFKLDKAGLDFLSNGPPSFRSVAPLFSDLRFRLITIVFDHSNQVPANIAFHSLEGPPSGEFVPGTGFLDDGTILFNPRSRTLQVGWFSKSFPRASWVDRGQFSSLWKLGGAHCFIALDNSTATPKSSEIMTNLFPAKLVLRFDTHALALYEFERVSAAFGAAAFHAALPDHAHILTSTVEPVDELFP